MTAPTQLEQILAQLRTLPQDVQTALRKGLEPPAEPDFPPDDEPEESDAPDTAERGESFVLWEPHPGPQSWFLQSSVYELLYGGAAGGGKTDCLLACLTEQTEHPDFRGLFLRKTYAALKEVVDRTRSLWSKLGATWNESKMTWTFPSGALVEFGYLETWADTERYQGRQFTVICYDELGQLAEERCWTFLMSRNRAVAPGLVKLMRASANPGGPGMSWIKRRFITICDRIGSPVFFPDREGGETLTRGFIAARVEDNPTLIKNDPGYLSRLNAMPEIQRKQLREGDWDAGEGMALGELAESKHIIPAFDVPDYWQRFGAFDWGFAHPFAFGSFAVDEDGNVYLVDTVHGARKQPHEIAARIAERVPVEKLRYIEAGHDCWADVRARGQDTPTIAETFAEYGIWLRQANIARVAGLNNLRKYLQWKGSLPHPDFPNNPDMRIDGVPRFRIMDTPGNRRTFAILSGVVTDPRDPEDVLKVDADESGEGGDDAYDMIRYGLASRPIKSIAPPLPALHAWHPDVLKAEMEYKRKLRSGALRHQRQKLLGDLGGF